MSVECVWRIEISSCQPIYDSRKRIYKPSWNPDLVTQFGEHEILANLLVMPLDLIIQLAATRFSVIDRL
jgi:hypothetical protein